MSDLESLPYDLPALTADGLFLAGGSVMQQDRAPRRAALPFVSVIVPVYNDTGSLRRLLQALAGQDYDAERFECVIIDNSAEANLAVVADEQPFAVRLLREQQPGSYAARNRGLCEARGEVLAFTDADCVPRRQWLSSAVERILAARGPIMLAGRVEVRQDCAESAFGWHSVVNDLNQARYISTHHFAATANMITTREVFNRVGAFNPTFLSGGDVEWGRRAFAAGIEQAYAEAAAVQHPARATWTSLVAKTRRIAGGHYALHREARHPLASTIRMVLRIAAVTLRRSWQDPRLPTKTCRLKVLALDFALRAIQLCEVIRLGLGGRPRR